MSQTSVECWNYPALGDTCDVRDGTHDSPKYVECGYPLITSKNLTEDGVSFENVNYITKADHDMIEKRSAVADGDILYGMIGTVGNPVIVKKNREFSVKNVAIFKFKDESEICNTYLLYALGGDYIARQIEKESKGGTQKFVSLKVLRGLKIPLPPLETQKQIAAVLEKADQLRKDCQQMEQEFNNLAQSVFIDMFGDPVTNPKGWDMQTVGDVAVRVTDGEHQTPKRTDNGYKLLSARNVQHGYLDVVNEKVDYIGEEEYQRISKRLVIEKTDVLLSCSGTIGRAALNTLDEPFCLVRSAAVIRLDQELLLPEFLVGYLGTSYMQSVMHHEANSSGQPNLFQNQIKKLKLYIPTLAKQKRYKVFLNKNKEQLLGLGQSRAQFDELFNTLMQKAFKGKLNLKSQEA